MTPAEQISPIAPVDPHTPWGSGWADWSRYSGPRDAMAIALLTVAAAASLFSLARPDTPWQDLTYLLVVPLCWTTVRASPRLAAVVFLAVALMATGTTLFAIGPFAGVAYAWIQLAIMLFLFALIMTSTAILVHDRTRVGDALAAANRGLEQLVARRTAALARSEEQFRAIVEIAPLPLMLIRPVDRVVLSLTPRAAE